jgi:hypothetical protein
MTSTRWRAAAAAALVVGLTGCASIPVAGGVHQGGDDVTTRGELAAIAAGPAFDAEPDAIVRGFILAAPAGPTSTTPFSVAKQYLTPRAGESWRPYAQVIILDGLPHFTVDPIAKGETRATVHASGMAVASLDENGVYSEESSPSAKEMTFQLGRSDGQWRITSLEDGLLVPSQVFASAYHPTSLYFPTPDLRQWVPDVRWFPSQTWRTNAVKEILDGPPAWLGTSVASLVPDGTALTINSVSQAPDGSVQVPLTDNFSEASAEERALFQAQLEATLSAGAGAGADVTLLDRNGPVAVPTDVALPAMPRTNGAALALQIGKLVRVAGRALADSDLAVDLHGLHPTALALSPDGQRVVVRDGADRIVRVTGDQEVLLKGTDVVAPSLDRYGTTWTASRGKPLEAVLASGGVYKVSAPWLEGRIVMSVRVSPDGARLAVVSQGAAGQAVQVAGILRNAQGAPTALADPVTVGASVHGVVQAVWQDEAVLALVGDDDDVKAVYLAGVGGLAGSVGGLPHEVTGLTDPTALTAAVGTGNMLALDADGQLHLRQSSALWPVVGQHVDLVAYPG